MNKYDEYQTIPRVLSFHPGTLERMMASDAGACVDCGGTGRDRNYDARVALTCWRCGGSGDEPDLPIYMESALRDARAELVGRRAA